MQATGLMASLMEMLWEVQFQFNFIKIIEMASTCKL